MKNSTIYLNGSFLPASKANINVFDRGLLYGDGLFETMRAYKGKVFALEEHLKRMAHGAKVLKIPFMNNTNKWQQIINKLLKLNNLRDKDSYIRITLTRGIDFHGLLPKNNIKPTIIVAAKPISAIVKKRQRTGIRAITINFSKASSQTSSIKSLNFIDNVIGIMMAKDMEADEAIFTSPSGEILEGTISNIFIVKNNHIKTPSIKSGILPGITRQFVINLAKKMGLKIGESPIKKIDILNSDEAFITNSIMEITPLIMVDKKIIGNGMPGKITRNIHKAYKNLAEASVHIYN
ncbi:MAG: aminotransferase class IV [Deltaproteobacteria bacterium]|nr:aminotransferase class IV [Deltaproteobacteria bacterium]